MGQVSSLSLCCAVALVVYIIIRLPKQQDDAGEPPSVHSTVPFVGHILGLFRYKVFYYGMLRDRTNAPIFAIPLPGAKIYVVTTPQLVTSVQRMVRPLAFAPVVAKFASRVCGCSEAANEIVNQNATGLEGEKGYVVTFFKTMLPPMMPGPNLDAMNRIMITSVGVSMDRLAGAHSARINLSKWLRHEITIATTNSVYGPSNPFKNSRVENAFWTFEENVLRSLINIFPGVTARTGIRAREIVANAFNDYFTKDQHLQGSSLVQARYNHSREHGISVEDIARFEVGGAFAILVNTYPTAYWIVYYVFSNPQVLQDCRKEILDIVTTTVGSDGTILHSIDMTSIKSNCPILTSTLQEVLRHRSVGTAIREVVEDAVLDGRYLLKKGCTVLMPSNVLHSDPAIWGQDAAQFDHQRFVKCPGKKLPSPVAFRAFGGGSTLCPGRHFATTELMAVATMLIARFDISPVGEAWPNADIRDVKLWSQILEPDNEFEVEIVERQQSGGQHKWTFGLTDSDILLALAAEDLSEPTGKAYSYHTSREDHEKLSL